uniref:Ig-like domain-containing protein n=1 Tax=Cyprinus carpio TaxID=7962 RepID=A0A8C1XVK6_CYPCA
MSLLMCVCVCVCFFLFFYYLLLTLNMTTVCVCVVCLGVECYSSGSYNRLTVKTGGSVTIPCYYDEKYTHQKKYWHSKTDNSRTYTNTTEENLSVIDNPDQNLFTVTMRNLQSTKHDGRYYCAVKIEGKPTVIYDLCLQVQPVPDVSVVNSSVSGHEGGNISVQCFYTLKYRSYVKQWCRYKDKSCYTVGRINTSQNSSVQISDDGRGSFTVLMTGLRLTDSGWYYCSAGEPLNPVQLTVIKAEPDKEKDTNNELLTVWLLVSAVLLLLLILISVFCWRWRHSQFNLHFYLFENSFNSIPCYNSFNQHRLYVQFC